MAVLSALPDTSVGVKSVSWELSLSSATLAQSLQKNARPPRFFSQERRRDMGSGLIRVRLL